MLKFLENKINNFPKENNLTTDNYDVYGSIFRKAKKGISPVVATALLLVVAVISVAGFQGWFTNFSSSVLVDVEEQTSSSGEVSVEGIFNDDLYLKSKGVNLEIDLLKVTDNLGNEVCSIEKSDLNVSSAGLVGHWKFDNTNDGIIKDYSGNGNDGKLYGDSKVLWNFDGGSLNDLTGYNNSLDGGLNQIYTSSGCVDGGCYSFNGNAYLYSNAPLDLPFGNSPRSACAWVNLDNNNFTGNILSYGGGLITNERFSILVDDGRVGFIGQGNDYKYFGNLSVGAWQHVCISFDLDILKIFIDGEKIAEKSSMTLNTSPTHNFRLGKNTDDRADEYFEGLIDEVSIYSKALSSGEISDLYNSKTAKFIEFKPDGLEFDGKDDFVEVLTSSSLNNFGSEITMFAKFELKDDLDVRQRILTKYSPGYSMSIRTLEHHGDSKYEPFINVDGSWIAPEGNQNLIFNNFYSLATTFDGSLINNYVNGVFENNYSVSGSVVVNASNNLFFGSSGNYNDEKFNGFLKDIKIYNRVLNLSEIKILSNPDLSLDSNSLNKVDLSSCNLNKGEIYSVLTGGSSGLSDVLVIVK